MKAGKLCGVGAVLCMLLLSSPAYSAPGAGTLFGTDASGGNLLTVDTSNGAGAIVGPTGVGAVPSLAVDPTTDILYAGAGDGSPNLYRVDQGTGAATLVGNTGLGFATIGALDFRSDGTLFASVNIVGAGGTGSDHLATIDTNTGVATVIGPYGTCNGQCTIEGMEGIAFDSNGALWGSVSKRGNFFASQPGLYGIDTSTGAATFLAPIQDGTATPPSGGVVSLQFGCDDTLYGGTARAVDPADDGGRLVTIDPTSGVFSFVGATSATGGPSLGGLAYAEPCTSRLISLRPAFKQNLTGTEHIVTATVEDDGGVPQAGVVVDFSVTAGPNQGTAGNDTTDANGEATFSYTGNTVGVDDIVAQFTDGLAVTHTSNLARKQWVAPSATETCNGLDDNGDGTIDEGFPDSDNDGIANCVDQDEDNDGINDGVDNCPQRANTNQADSDGDGLGDACDPNIPPIVNPPNPEEIHTDGQFEPPTDEWTAITPASFLAGDSFVYAAVEGQDIYLMYDYRLNTQPMAVGERVGPISFQIGSGQFFDVFVHQGGPNTDLGPHPATSEGGNGDTVEVYLNGALFNNFAGCVEGAVDHNSTSPHFAEAHNLVELEVRLRGFGACYSPEPAFWSATLPSVTPSAPGFARGASSPTTENVQTSAAFFKVEPDGTTEVTPLGISDTGYPRPRGATPVVASLVIAYKECVDPTTTHGEPLAFSSCGPPVPASSNLTVGTPDAPGNGAGARSIGFVVLRAILGEPDPGDQADARIETNISDVRCQAGVATCGDANASGGADYTGQVQVRVDLRITDTNASTGTQPGTGDQNLRVNVPCGVSSTPASIGSTCALTTTADAVYGGSGAVLEGARTIWEAGQVRVFDGGTDGDPTTDDGDSLFEVQGVFVP